MFDRSLLWDKSWEDFFEEHEKMLEDILYRVEKEVFFPDIQKVFRFTAIAPDKVRGVIVGMDPYPTYTIDESGRMIPEATGRSFEVASVDSWQQKFRQASLRNFLKAIYEEMTQIRNASLDEIRADLISGKVKIPKPHEWFNLMEGRGIMFLNLGLTVEPDRPGSHLRVWEPFTKEVIGYIKECSPKATWMLFGKDAQDTLYETVKDCDVVYACHPRLAEFVKARPFRKIIGGTRA